MRVAYHFVAILSHYKEGMRIGWHYSNECKLDKEVLQTFLSRVKKKCGDIHLGIHKLSTESVTWESVVEKDSFFSDIIVTTSGEKFIELAIQDQYLAASDVAKFILTILPSSHLKLQKLLYFCYAEFLKRTGTKLFDDSIVAFKYGPVVEDVFFKYRSYGSSIIDYKEDELFTIHAIDAAVTPSFIKLESSIQGRVALSCILDVLKKYKSYSATELVEITHKSGGPWSKVFKPGLNVEISDDLISLYHPGIEV